MQQFLADVFISKTWTRKHTQEVFKFYCINLEIFFVSL